MKIKRIRLIVLVISLLFASILGSNNYSIYAKSQIPSYLDKKEQVILQEQNVNGIGFNEPLAMTLEDFLAETPYYRILQIKEKENVDTKASIKAADNRIKEINKKIKVKKRS